ncbi:MAG: STT3 domain-containing protein [Thermoproteota archaeon]|nr:glycosyltransferase family 39 protein [Candidatus Brockarchaeota archaeon]MBO3768358.1 glycosyltransferase family 39 protein [Candidatus Brockarchaeota archaeon]MBO3800800.1 glycosyltransferase family 39 protein [Candidatus Brockarchaeota archaeon]
MSVKGALNNFKSMASKINKLRPFVDSGTYLIVSVLVVSAALAITIRLLNFRYGFYLSEFDPYWHYRAAEYIAEHGVNSFLTWLDKLSWVPEGRWAAGSTPIGLPLALDGFYYFVRFLGLDVDMLTLAILFPPISSIFAVIAVFLLGREIANNEVGALSSILIAFSGSLIDRTHLGFFKHETIGIPLIAFSLYFFIKGVKEENKMWSFLFSILAGLSLGYLSISWTGYLFATGLIALLTIVISIFSNTDLDKLLLVSSTTFGLYLSIAAMFPRERSEILSLNLALIVLSLVFVVLKKEIDQLQTLRLKILVSLGFFCSVILLAVVGVHLGLLSSLYGKIAAIINPFIRSQEAIVESVAEHKVSSWYTIFNDNGLALLLFAFSIVVAFSDLSNVNNIFILTSGLASLYFSTLMVRLELIFSPFSSVFSAYGAYLLISKVRSSEVLKVMERKLKRTFERPWWISSIVIVLFVTSLLTPSVVLGYTHAGVPVTISSASLPYAYEFPDWFQALEWLRENTPPGSVIMAWWDYGYWITTLGDRPTIIDNATINTTQVALVGKAFISNDTIAIPIMKKFNVSYILVFSTMFLAYYFWSYNKQKFGYWGDEVKWIWMAEIGYSLPTEPTHNKTLTLFGDRNLSQSLAKQGLISSDSYGNPDLILPNRTFVLTKLLVLSAFDGQQSIIPSDPHFSLVFMSSDGLVSIFKVNYNYTPPERIISLSASSEANKTKDSSWNDSYEFAPNRTITFNVLSLSANVGKYIDSNGMAKNLNASVEVRLVDSFGNIKFEITPSLGPNELVILPNKIIYTANNETKVFSLSYRYPLHLEFHAIASSLPTNYKKVLENANASLVVSDITIGWL